MTKPMSNALREILENETRRCPRCKRAQAAIDFYVTLPNGSVEPRKSCASCRGAKKFPPRRPQQAEYVNASQAADAVGMSRKWFLRQVKDGLIKFERVGRELKIDRRELESEQFRRALDEGRRNRERNMRNRRPASKKELADARSDRLMQMRQEADRDLERYLAQELEREKAKGRAA